MPVRVSHTRFFIHALPKQSISSIFRSKTISNSIHLSAKTFFTSLILALQTTFRRFHACIRWFLVCIARNGIINWLAAIYAARITFKSYTTYLLTTCLLPFFISKKDILCVSYIIYKPLNFLRNET